MKYKKSESGFTLVEMLIVILIMGIVSKALAPNFVQEMEDRKTDQQMIVHLVELTRG